MGDSLKNVTGAKRRASVRTIDKFFSKKSKSEPETRGESSSLLTSTSVDQICHFVPAPKPVALVVNEHILPDRNKPRAQPQFSSDIGYYTGQTNLNDFTKAMLLEQHWTPPSDYVFPHCIVTKKGKETKKYAQRSHLEKFHWLVLSHKDQGLYCKYCVLFAAGSGGGLQTNTPLRRMVKEPLKSFDDLLGGKGSLMTHQWNQYHQWAVEAGKNFILTYHQPSLEVANQVCSQREAQVKENREHLRPIVSTIIFCGRQNISLRGHRDDGVLHEYGDGPSTNVKLNANNEEASSVVKDYGNFRALLRFRVDSGDSNLRHHLETTSANATYISKTTQNQLIDICKEEIQESILARVNEAKLFSVLFDETTDESHIEQLSISFRYLHNGSVREDFITFCNAYDMLRSEDVDGETRLTGIALAHIVLDLCKKFNVDMTNCVEIGTDSCSVMVSGMKGAVHELAKTAIHAKHCPCNNHLLNNSLARSSNVVHCRNTSATMKKIVLFANASAKRHELFKKVIGGTSLQGICETRWVERHDGHLQFQGDTLVKICDALYEISQWKDSKTASDAQCLRHALISQEFIVSSICLSDVLGTTVSLSRLLQTHSLDLKRAMDAVTDTISVLEKKRQEADLVFQQLFAEAADLARELDVELKTPRIVSRQIYRENYFSQPNVAQSPEEYYRRVVYIPLLDNIISDLKKRLSPDVMDIFSLGILLPRTTYTEEDLEVVRKVAEMYKQLLNVPVSTVLEEFKLWVAKWKRESGGVIEIPSALPHIIDLCDTVMYPSINKLLKILATLPVSVATAERSFSTLRRLKTWLRSTMGEERLTGLALLHIHKDIQLDIEAIITKLAKNSKRRLEFIL